MFAAFPVTDPADPRIGCYRDIRERDLVGREGRFVAEGRVVLEKLIASGLHVLESVLVAEGRLAGMSDVLARLPQTVAVYVASRAVMDAVVGFPIHRGVLGVGLRREPALGDLLAGLPERALVVALAGIANHDNMGGLFRNAAAFGADAVVLDDQCCDPLYRKAIRVSVGAALTTPFAVGGEAAALVQRLKAADFEVVALSPSGRQTLAELTVRARTAVLFGAEGPGLPDAVLAEARTVRIPMAGGFDSLNVSTTSGIVLHHLRAQVPF